MNTESLKLCKYCNQIPIIAQRDMNTYRRWIACRNDKCNKKPSTIECGTEWQAIGAWNEMMVKNK